MVVSSQDAEQQLLRAFQNGQVDVLTGTKKLDPTWFDEAEYLCGQGETLLENRRLPVSVQITMLSGGERYIQRLDPDEHKVRVRVPSAQVIACFPAQDQTATMQEAQAISGNLNEVEPGSSISRPRRRGNVSLSSADTPFIREMHDLYVSGAVASINAAAWKVVDRAPGNGAPQSKVDRLRRRYAKEYPADPAERSN
ncbi:hypothetical protein ACFOYU_00145 [Microvirga sp. GCM10011540]|uniref:hypothetical protein n=1 Tax=Microvirga sp. GCM10011540 TaxID=3317338 RepID=UPI0036231CCB